AVCVAHPCFPRQSRLPLETICNPARLPPIHRRSVSESTPFPDCRMSAHEQARAAAPLSQKEGRAIIIVLLPAIFLAARDQTIVATALPTIGHDLNDLEHLPW